MPEIARVTCTDKLGTNEYVLTLLKEFNTAAPEFDEAKLTDLWVESAKHDVLFSDHTRGDPKAFLIVMLDPRSTIIEVSLENQPVGLLHLTDIIPHFDAQGHFTFWDGVASGREPIIWTGSRWVMDHYDLRRISSEIVPTQRGVIRFMERCGFVKEGEKREATVQFGEWKTMLMYGLLKSDLEAKEAAA